MSHALWGLVKGKKLITIIWLVNEYNFMFSLFYPKIDNTNPCFSYRDHKNPWSKRIFWFKLFYLLKHKRWYRNVKRGFGYENINYWLWGGSEKLNVTKWKGWQLTQTPYLLIWLNQRKGVVSSIWSRIREDSRDWNWEGYLYPKVSKYVTKIFCCWDDVVTCCVY